MRRGRAPRRPEGERPPPAPAAQISDRFHAFDVSCPQAASLQCAAGTLGGQSKPGGRCARGEGAPSRRGKRRSLSRDAGGGPGRPADHGEAASVASAGTGRVGGNAGSKRERFFIGIRARAGKGEERAGAQGQRLSPGLHLPLRGDRAPPSTQSGSGF